MGKTTRVVVCGMKGVGKTKMLERLIYGNDAPNTETYPTIEDIYVANIESDRGTKEKIQFYDTAGLEPSVNYASAQQLPRQYLSFADGYVLVYDMSKPESFNVVMTLKTDIDKSKDKKETTIIVMANKPQTNTDNPDVGRLALKSELWCKQNKVRCFEVDLSDRASLYEAFIYLSSKLNPPPTKSTFPQLTMGRKTVKTENS